METGMEKYLKDKMEEASLRELMPAFDKQQEWNVLAKKLHPKKKIIFVPVWARAAAVLLLLASGWLLVQNRGNHSDVTSATGIAAIPRSNNEVVKQAGSITTPDTLYPVTAATSAPAKVNSPAHRDRRPIPMVLQTDTATPIAQNLEPKVMAIPTDSMPTNNTPPPQPLQVIAKKPRPQAIHLLDLDNEDRKFMITEEYKGNPTGIIARIQNMLVPTETVANNDIPNPSQIIFKK